jgi:hypothetical protein
MMDNTNLRPISEAYWVKPGQFLAGEYPARFDEEITRKRIDALLQAGLNTFIDLTNANESIPYANILLEQASAYSVEAVHHRFPIGDFGLPTPDRMNAILDKIEESLRTGRRIYLHCWGGIGRTGTTVGCYLVRQGKSPEEALDQLSAWWRSVPKSQYHPESPETREQVNFILAWATQDGRLQKNQK